MTDFPRGTLVRVRWVDIVSENEWRTEDTLEPPPIIETVGFYLGRKVFHTLSCMILAGSMSHDDGISNTDIIPDGTIISIENLGE